MSLPEVVELEPGEVKPVSQCVDAELQEAALRLMSQSVAEAQRAVEVRERQGGPSAESLELMRMADAHMVAAEALEWLVIDRTSAGRRR